MIGDYFHNDGPGSPQKKQDTSGSFGFRSSQFSHKNNISLDRQVKNIDPSFFNQSSIKKLNNSESGEFIYFQNDSILSELELQLNNKKKSQLKQQQPLKKKKDAISFSKDISFQDSMQKSIQNNDSAIKEYGTGKSNLPPTLKKPKFGFKISETAQSSAIIKDIEPQAVAKQITNQYQLKLHDNNKIKSKLGQLKDISKHSALQNSRSLRLTNKLQKDDSISSIKKPYDQPSVISKSLSQSNSLNGSMNFKSAFKHKVQKASVINSSLNKKYNATKSNKSILQSRELNKSNSKNDLLQKQVKIAELKDLRQLQNKLGELKHQNKKIIEYMIEKDQQIQKLKKRKIQIEAEDPYAIMKQNQLMKAFLSANKKDKKSSTNLKESDGFGNTKNLNSAKSMKQISSKKCSQVSSLHDYDIKEHKFKVQTRAITKAEKKFILSNRGMVLSEKYLDVGYSLKDNILTLYLTLKKEYEQVCVKLQQNSFILSEPIDRVFHDSAVGKQIKFKTEIKSTKCVNPQDLHTPLCLKISFNAEQKFQNQLNQFKVQLPITVYNIAKQLDLVSNIQSSGKISKLSAKQVFKTQTFVACKQMIRDPENYLLKIFPTGTFYKDQHVFQVGILWKQKKDCLRIRIKERSFLIQGQGNPNKGTFQLLRSIVSLLIEQKQQI